MTDRGVFSLASIPLQSVRRLSTGIRALDLAYGVSVLTDRRGKPIDREFGLPCGGLSLWAGQPGVGKSRLCIAVAAGMNKAGYRALYFQNESTLSECRQWTAAQVAHPHAFLVSDITSLEGQLQAIRRHRPHVAFDANYWKSFVHARLAVAPGNPGALTLFDKGATEHLLFAEHVGGSETWTLTHGQGRDVQEWKLKPTRPDNRWLDCLVGSAGAASICGISLPGMQARPSRRRKRYTQEDLTRR